MVNGEGLLLILDRGEVAEGRVQALSVVTRPRCTRRSPAARSRVGQDWRWINSCLRVENQLSATVPAFPGLREALDDPVGVEQSGEIPGVELTGPIGMEDQPGGGTATLEGHRRGIHDQRGAHVVGHGPPDDPPGGQVEHRGQVQPFLPGPHVGAVGHVEAVDIDGAGPNARLIKSAASASSSETVVRSPYADNGRSCPPGA